MQQLKRDASQVLVRQYIPLWAVKDRGIKQLSAAQQDEVMGQFAAAGDQQGLQWMHKQLRRIPATVVVAAACTGKLNVLIWAKAHGCSIEHPALCSAARHGRLDVIQWLEERGDIDVITMDSMHVLAALGGQLNVLRWAKSKVAYTMDTSAVSKAAVAKGHLGVLSWMQEEGLALTNDACAVAARHGQLEVLMWLREEPSENWDAQTTMQAARAGHLQLLQWALDHSCPWDDRNLFYAAYAGQADVVQWVVERGLPDQRLICSGAAAGGHLQLLQWARGRGMYWDQMVLSNALKARESGGPHVEVFGWALENGCPYDMGTVSLAGKAVLRELPRLIVRASLLFLLYFLRGVWRRRRGLGFLVAAVFVFYIAMVQPV